MSNLSKLKEKAAGLPLLPGVYLMKDKDGSVIYVGKAVKLRNRVSSYFRSEETEDFKTDTMISQVTDFDTVTVNSEFEALLLENALIKDLQPRYNIKLKDDKGYPVIRVDVKSMYPMFKIASHPVNDDALYLGPYGGRTETRRALGEVCRAFKLPTCGKKIDKIIGKERPCLNFDLKNCLGYCTDIKLKAEHEAALKAAINVFQGKTGQLVKDLTKEMTAASDSLDFEMAAILRDRIKAIKKLEQKQFFTEDPIDTGDAAHKEKILKTHVWLEKALGLEKTPGRIEAFDISNTADSNIVGAMIVFQRGKPVKKDYRLFKIKTKKNRDDYGSMAEIVTRRIKRYIKDDEKFNTLPDIMLIDGGANHAQVVKKALDKLDISIPVFGMVKDDKHRTRALVTPGGEEIGLSANPAVFAFIGTIQEETHRFAIEFHRKQRSKSMLEQNQDDITKQKSKQKSEQPGEQS